MPQTRNRAAIAVADRRMPLTFHPVTKETIPLLRRMLTKSATKSCDYTVGGIAMWTRLFDYEYCVFQDTLFIKSLSEDASGRTAFLWPVGDMPAARKISLLSAYCRRSGIDLLLTAVPEDRLGEITSECRCKFTELTDWADYVYDAGTLASLTGKAYNKKRNHVNRFIADNPGYVLEDITEANIDEVQRFFASLGIESLKDDRDMADFEWSRCADVLAHYSSYGFEGALLRQGDGRIAAFTMGEMSGDTLVLHIEKIEHLIAGAGETINKLFAERMMSRHPEMKYINREDDAGDPGLRKAKMSYHPAFLLKKFNVEIG